MTPQEAAEEAFENYWESRGFGLRDNITDEEIMPFIEAFISGTKWQSEQNNQSLSSALKEIAEIHAWKKEMLQLWNKLDAYIETRNDIRLGESKVDFAIKIMKDQAELHAKLHEMSEYITKVQSKNDYLEFANSELHAEVRQLELDLEYATIEMYRINGNDVILKYSELTSPESHSEPDSTDLPPEVTT